MQDTENTAVQGGGDLNGTQEPQGGEKPEEARIFSQADVNRMIGKRLAEEKERNETLMKQKEYEFTQRELQYKAQQMVEGKGLPPSLLNVMDYSDEAAFTKAVDALESLMEERVMQRVEEKLCGGVPRLSRDITPAEGVRDAVRDAMGLK